MSTSSYKANPKVINTIRRITFHTDERIKLYAQLIDIEGKKFVGFQKMWFNTETKQWQYSKKSFYMAVEYWTDFNKMIGEMDGAIKMDAEHLAIDGPTIDDVRHIPTVGSNPNGNYSLTKRPKYW